MTAQIDVSQLLADPDFVDEICLVQRTPVVDNFGVNTLQEKSTKTIGSVQPASGKVIQRIPESLRVANMSSFWLKGTIVAGPSKQYTSILIFKGQRYQVQTVFDWSNFGEGYTEGVCVAEVPA